VGPRSHSEHVRDPVASSSTPSRHPWILPTPTQAPVNVASELALVSSPQRLVAAGGDPLLSLPPPYFETLDETRNAKIRGCSFLSASASSCGCAAHTLCTPLFQCLTTTTVAPLPSLLVGYHVSPRSHRTISRCKKSTEYNNLLLLQDLDLKIGVPLVLVRDERDETVGLRHITISAASQTTATGHVTPRTCWLSPYRPPSKVDPSERRLAPGVRAQGDDLVLRPVG
jgi:hypothetical protein